MDVAMPRMDGVQTLECLRAMELGHHTPVVFVAAGLAPLESAAVCRRRAAEVIRLPFDASEVAGVIRSIWSRIAD
jgi:CheY-like chemotaxis protein